MVERQKKMAELLLPHVGERTIKSLCELAVISPALWYRIVNDTVRPGQDVLLRLAFVLEMTPNDTQELLKSGHCALLTADSKRDVAIIYGYNRFEPDVMTVCVILLVIIVTVVQVVGDLVTRRLDHR